MTLFLNYYVVGMLLSKYINFYLIFVLQETKSLIFMPRRALGHLKNLGKWAIPTTKKTHIEKAEKEQKELEGPMKYADAERKELSNSISGAIYKVAMDKSHPLAFGLDDYYYSLRTNEQHYIYLDKGWNVGVLKGKQKPVMGFAGSKINKKLENTLVFGVEDKGKGPVVYLVDNPMFRCFWENGKMLFANAVFMVGQ